MNLYISCYQNCKLNVSVNVSLKDVGHFKGLSLRDPDRLERKSPQDYLFFDRLMRHTKDTEIKIEN